LRIIVGVAEAYALENNAAFKIPRSALVIIHTPEHEVLLVERTDHRGFWQSVTGSQEAGESLLETAIREVEEETGIRARVQDFLDWKKQNEYEIFATWRARYAPEVTHNTEHVFSLMVPGRVPVRLRAREHTQCVWLDAVRAAPLCFSWSNREAIEALESRVPRK
jgi:dihydroneopterin triphosphate diphosphatase